jgi:hypothetical protein
LNGEKRINFAIEVGRSDVHAMTISPVAIRRACRSA